MNTKGGKNIAIDTLSNGVSGYNDDDLFQEGDAEATCDIGGIPSPVCGACSFALSLFLTIALFLTLL